MRAFGELGSSYTTDRALYREYLNGYADLEKGSEAVVCPKR